MKRQQALISYLLSFIIIAILLKLFGIIDFANSEILGYAMIFYGISSVYFSLGKDQKLHLFTGTVVFLIGILLFIINNFEIFNIEQLIPPSIMLIGGVGFIMLFIDEDSNFVSLIIGVVFVIIGITVTIKYGTINFVGFLEALWRVSKIYWAIFIVILGILFFLSNGGEKEK